MKKIIVAILAAMAISAFAFADEGMHEEHAAPAEGMHAEGHHKADKKAAKKAKKGKKETKTEAHTE